MKRYAAIVAVTLALVTSLFAAASADTGRGSAARETSAPKSTPVIPTIEIKAAPAQPWRVTWRAPSDLRELVFPRSADDSRVHTWTAPADFEITVTEGSERVRRRDGAPFRTVTLEVPAAYRFLPKDYAPFAPFGDGGLLFHTGRLFACGGDCPSDAHWAFRLRFNGWRHALVEGRFHASPVVWTDSGAGRYVYVGDTTPLATPQLDAVLDRALPDAIRDQLLRQLPAFMTLFADRLGPVRDKLTVFVSYDVSPQQGGGRQGGVLPGQVTVHFYGAQWPQQMTEPGFADDLAWHFAHEAAHVYQRQLEAEEGGGAWIHEGGAEAFAALAMRTVAPEADAYVDARIAEAPDACRRILGTRSVREAIKAGDFDASYACGLVIALVIDQGVRRVRPDLDGLYAVWRDYLELAGAGPASADRAALFLDCVERAGGAGLAAWVQAAASDPQPVLDLPDPGPVPTAARGADQALDGNHRLATEPLRQPTQQLHIKRSASQVHDRTRIRQVHGSADESLQGNEVLATNNFQRRPSQGNFSRAVKCLRVHSAEPCQ